MPFPICASLKAFTVLVYLSVSYSLFVCKVSVVDHNQSTTETYACN